MFGIIEHLNLFKIFILLIFPIAWSCNPADSVIEESKSELPNIVIFYLDDLGYGDTEPYGASGIPTPNINRLAEEGLLFTQAYSTSATCTPSRFGLLTGVYPWRNSHAKILPGDAPLVIDTSMVTLPKMLQKAGYVTGVTGKWHLGLGYDKIDWNQKINPGANEVGFDYSFIMAATQDRVPTVFIEDGIVVGLDPDDPIEVNYQVNFSGEPTGKDNPDMLKLRPSHGHDNSIVNGISRIGFMKGGENAKWVDEEMADVIFQKAKSFVKANKENPFFLYYPMRQPHVPRTPNPRFVGSTKYGPRGDVIVEADAMIGEFLQTLEEENLLNNTFIIFTSDNGPVVDDGYQDRAVELLGEHRPGGIYRGGKYSLYDAGTHIPFITWWPAKIRPGVSDALVCQLDIFQSLANLVGDKSKYGEKDSQDLLDVFLGRSDDGRDNLVLEATTRTAFRNKNWVMIPPYPGPKVNNWVNIELGNNEEYQLFNLDEDPSQKNDLAYKFPEILDEMIEGFKSARGRNFDDKIESLELK